jgi:DnaJ domain
MTTSIHITNCNDDTFSVRIRSKSREVFDDLITELKESIPSHSRIFQPTTKSWTVYGREHLDQWLKFARELGAKIEWTEEEAPRRMSLDYAHKVLHVMPSAPPGVIHAAYQALAKVHHPDRGGDLERMKVINQAHDLLMEGGNV